VHSKRIIHTDLKAENILLMSNPNGALSVCEGLSGREGGVGGRDGGMEGGREGGREGRRERGREGGREGKRVARACAFFSRVELQSETEGGSVQIVVSKWDSERGSRPQVVSWRLFALCFQSKCVHACYIPKTIGLSVYMVGLRCLYSRSLLPI